MAILDLSDKKNFKVFLVVDIVLTVIITVLGIFLLPFFGWVIGDMEIIAVLVIISVTVSMGLLILWLVLFFINIRRGRNKRWWLLCVVLSLGVIGGTHELVFDSNIGVINGEKYWNCLVANGICYNRFGIEKFRGEKIWRVYDEKGRKKIIRLFNSKGELDEFNYDGEDVEVQWYRMEIWEYDSYGEYVGKVKNDYVCKWFKLPNSFVKKYDLDGEYYYDGEYYRRQRDLEDIVIKDSRNMLLDEGFAFE